METAHTYATLASRLSLYGLEHREEALRDLVVDPGETAVLTADESELRPHYATLRPNSPHDLKRWIGIADTALEYAHGQGIEADAIRSRAAHDCAGGFIPHPPIDRANPEMQTNLYRFLFEHSRHMSATQVHSIKTYVDQASIAISAISLLDIYVSKRARLIVDAKTQVLFARYIYVEETGVIEMQSPFSKIDCAGMKTLGRFFRSTAELTHPVILRGVSRSA